MFSTTAQGITGRLSFPGPDRAVISEAHGPVSWLVDNQPANSPLGNDDLARAASRMRALGHQPGDLVTVTGIRSQWWTGHPIVLMVDVG